DEGGLRTRPAELALERRHEHAPRVISTECDVEQAAADQHGPARMLRGSSVLMSGEVGGHKERILILTERDPHANARLTRVASTSGPPPMTIRDDSVAELLQNFWLK